MIHSLYVGMLFKRVSDGQLVRCILYTATTKTGANLDSATLICYPISGPDKGKMGKYNLCDLEGVE